MQTTIYVIRHGEVYNPKIILYGRLPHFKLSQKGIKQLEVTADYLADKPITAIFSSPMLRAKQSAKIIQKKLHLPKIIITKQIIEVDTSYQGKLFSDLDPIQSEVYLKPLRKTDETIDQLAQRMERFVHSLIKKYPGKQIVFVSHGDLIMALQAAIKKFPLVLSSIRTGNGITYVKHGEVLQITADQDNNISIASVFQPKV